MDLTGLQRLLAQIAGRRVICVGDVMLDRYVYGEVERISPEAPIPVMARSRELEMLGGAGNVARNLAALGARAVLIGVVGADAEGEAVLEHAASGVEPALVRDAARPTALKTRFVAGGQQLLRVDREIVLPIAGEVERRVVEMIGAAAQDADVLLLSDYGKGVVSDAVIAACHATGLPTIVDSKAHRLDRYGPVAVIKPNASELARVAGLPTTTDDEVEAAIGRALELCRAQAIFVTRSAKGASIGGRAGVVRHFQNPPREVFDVAGAGDTALAAFGLAKAAGASDAEAVELAMLASGVVVEKAGAAVVHPEELVEALLAPRLGGGPSKIVTPERMIEQLARWRADGLRIGFTNGCFDILHRGHITYLSQARSWCDRLIVGVNSDASIQRLKGDGRPVNDLESRCAVLAGLTSVDLVAPFDEDTPLKLIEAARPDVLVKGADYAENQVVGADMIKAWGGQVRLADIVEGYSTTNAIARMQRKA